MVNPKYLCSLNPETGEVKVSGGYVFKKEEIFKRINSDLKNSYSDFNRSEYRIPGQNGSMLAIQYIKYLNKTFFFPLGRGEPDLLKWDEALYCAIATVLGKAYQYDNFYAGGACRLEWDVKRLFDI
ncbi:hypothetical protein IJH66_01790 [Candidatus Saccharibacteria bacterium]|nr:hypothetical protein [Candidatus Saccharibacteria bacterium]MBQ6605697.1 hypothetical protein [Candidatus Saccharibacteria bacterium]